MGHIPRVHTRTTLFTPYSSGMYVCTMTYSSWIIDDLDAGRRWWLLDLEMGEINSSVLEVELESVGAPFSEHTKVNLLRCHFKPSQFGANSKSRGSEHFAANWFLHCAILIREQL